MDTAVGDLFHLFLQFLLINAALGLKRVKFLLLIYIITDIFLRNLQHERIFCRCRDDVFRILRVEEFYILHRDAQHLVKLVKMKGIVNHNGVNACLDDSRVERTNIMFGRIIHHIVHRDESRHITTCLTRQIWPNCPVILDTSSSADSFFHIACTRVISRKRKEPVAKHRIKVVEVLTCRFC